MAVNLTTVGHLLDQADELIHARDGAALEDADSIRDRSTVRAEVTRDLLRLSDLLATASALAREEYWRLKDYSSPIPRIGEVSRQ